MQFRRSGQRDERRRRVLIDETTADSGQANLHQSIPVEQGGYSAAALRENQPYLTDVIPQRLRTWCLLVVLAASAVYGLYYGSTRTATDFPEVAERLSLVGTGTVAAWFSSAVLLLAALGSGMVYLVRRHKVDDYRGYYRFWGWLAGWCVLASLETTTGIHDALQGVIALLPLTVSPEEYQWGWLLTVALTGLFLGTRMTIEVRDSYWTNCFWFPAIVAYGLVMLIQFEVNGVQAWLPEVLTPGLLILVAHVCLVGTIWMEARHVVREAQGLVAPAKVKTARLPVEVDPDSEEVETEFPEPVVEEEDVAAEINWCEEESEDQADHDAQRIQKKLSRAERKRARRQRRKERRKQAA